MPQQDVILQATGLTFAYGRRTVLEHVDLTIRTGEFWVCLGLNGEGKTTLLRGLLGALTPPDGHLWLAPELASRQRIGFVPQRCDFNPALPTTVREFVLLGTVGTHMTRRDRAVRLEWALARVGLHDMAKQSYWALSGGQQQRALVARALLRRPSLLLLDEPTSGFDLPTTDAFLHCLVELNRHDHVAILFIAHDVALAARYATHVALLRGGHLVAGPVHEVLTQAHLEHVYGVAMDVSRDASGAVTVHMANQEGPL